MSALLPSERSAKALISFGDREIVSGLIAKMTAPDFNDNRPYLLGPEIDMKCPKCGGAMSGYNFNEKLKFHVTRCNDCQAIWVKSSQIPIVSFMLLEDEQEDLAYRRSVNELYTALIKHAQGKPRSFNDMVAPYIAVPGAAKPAQTVMHDDDDEPVFKGRPYVTVAVITACMAISVMQFFDDRISGAFSLIVNNLYSKNEWHRIITHAFLHNSVLHLIGNMFFLWIFGRRVECGIGRIKFISIYILGAIAAGLFFMGITGLKDIPCAGASGAISAVIGAYFIFYPHSKIKFNLFGPISGKGLKAEASCILFILAWFAMNLVFGIYEKGGAATSLAYWGHIGGFAAGILIAEFYKFVRRS